MQLAYVAGAGLLLAGCGRLGFDPIASTDAAATDTPTRTCVTDDFSSLDLVRWNPYMAGPSLQVTGGQLVITPVANANGYAGLNAVATDFTDGTMSIEVPQVVGQPNVENYILLFTNNQNFYAIGYDGGRMHYYRRDAGIDTAMTEVYSGADRFWLIGHTAATNEVYFSAGATLASVTERYRLPVTVPITNLKVEIAAGSYTGGTASPGQAVFDNFQLCLR